MNKFKILWFVLPISTMYAVFYVWHEYVGSKHPFEDWYSYPSFFTLLILWLGSFIYAISKQVDFTH